MTSLRLPILFPFPLLIQWIPVVLLILLILAFVRLLIRWLVPARPEAAQLQADHAEKSLYYSVLASPPWGWGGACPPPRGPEDQGRVHHAKNPGGNVKWLSTIIKPLP